MAMPEDVRGTFGFGAGRGKVSLAKSRKSFETAGGLEIAEGDAGGVARAVYSARFADGLSLANPSAG
jgi:hypothetical protein